MTTQPCTDLSEFDDLIPQPTPEPELVPEWIRRRAIAGHLHGTLTPHLSYNDALALADEVFDLATARYETRTD